MEWREEYLDLVLVPIGFIIFLGYHLLLLYRTLMRPNTTYFGSELRQRRLSLRHMFQVRKTWFPDSVNCDHGTGDVKL